MMLGQGGEDLAIKGDLLLEFGPDELRVRVTKRAKSCVDLHAPEAAEVVLLVLAVGELVDTCLAEGNLCLDLLAGASMAEALCKLQDLTAVFVGGDSSFDA